MTNYERIKAMSVEEMAKLLGGICPYALDPISKKTKNNRTAKMFEWNRL